MDGGFGSVEGVGGQVGTAVEHEDEAERARSEELMWSEEELGERGADRFHHWAFARCIFHNASSQAGVSFCLALVV